MRELTALILVFVFMKIPWSWGGFFMALSCIGSLGSLLYLCVAIVERFYIGDKTGFRINPGVPILPDDDDVPPPPMDDKKY